MLSGRLLSWNQDVMTVLELCVATSCVNRESWGTMVLTVGLEDVTVLICTAWALTLRMFSIQSQGALLSPRSASLWACGARWRYTLNSQICVSAPGECGVEDNGNEDIFKCFNYPLKALQDDQGNCYWVVYTWAISRIWCCSENQQQVFSHQLMMRSPSQYCLSFFLSVLL